MEFIPFPKIARLARLAIISEKIDGTNAQVMITEDGDVFAGSRTRWITPEDDNYGFARWVAGNKDTLLKLGPGRHMGEWWGLGINRNYGLKEKRFSLFNVLRWCPYGQEPERIPTADPRIEKWQEALPEGLLLVPELRRCEFSTRECHEAVGDLRECGSFAAPGFSKPEGIVCFHVAANTAFKMTLDNDGLPKGKI